MIKVNYIKAHSFYKTGYSPVFLKNYWGPIDKVEI
jgi:hypothetical protein